MRKFAFLMLLWMITAGIVSAEDLTVSDAGSGGCTPVPPDPDACWSETGELSQSAVSSMNFDLFEVDSQTANDFIFDEDSEIVHVRWWASAW